jgi:hypothetical protein
MAIEEQVLREISENVQRVGDSSESFRTTANRQNSNIQKIVKDISEMFRAQSATASELSSSIDGLQNQMAQATDKTDAVASSLEQTIQVQNSMLGELKGIGKGIDSLSNMILMMMQNNSGYGGGGGGGTATSLLKALATTAGLGVGAGALASIFGSNYIQNNSTNNNNQTASPMGGSEPGGTQTANIMAALRQQESGSVQGDYKAQNPESTASGAYGFTDPTWKDATAAAGIGQEYAKAKDAPQMVQDQVAQKRVEYLLNKVGGDVNQIPVIWHGGETRANDPSMVNAADEKYRTEWIQKYQQISQQSTTNSLPGTSNDYAQFLMSRAQGGVDAEKLNPSFAAKLTRAIQEAEQVTGEKIQITSGVRSAEQQAQLYANYIGQAYNYNGKTYIPDLNNRPSMAAEPGNSAHETGNAVDLQGGAARDYIMKNAAKFGLQDLPGDPPHISDRAESAGRITPSAGGAAGGTTVAGSEDLLGLASLLGTNSTEQQRTGSLMEGLGMPAGLGPGSEGRPIGMGDMSSYNPIGILGSAMGGNMFMPSGQSGAIGAALNVLSGVTSGMFSPEKPPEEKPVQNQAAMEQQQRTTPWVDPDMYNHPEDRTISPSWSDRIMGMFSQETSGILPSRR